MRLSAKGQNAPTGELCPLTEKDRLNRKKMLFYGVVHDKEAYGLSFGDTPHEGFNF